ncbi:MAG: phenylalanine--tRNA ligase subunit alpha [Myxococcales bacterium]|nr:phenylalanine--tRNA ligase subunit alpha [Myxococcales bacterium]
MSEADTADVVTAFEQGLAEAAEGYAAAFGRATDEHALRAQNARLLGPAGSLTKLLKRMSQLPADRRREFGKRANELKRAIDVAFEERLSELARAEREAELSGPMLDVSLPGFGRLPGRVHLLSRVKHELLDLFATMGFDVADGPEVELHENNFDKLGFPPDHPATDMQDTFFMKGPPGSDPRATLLRTHTSTVQVREMLRRKPPLAVVSAGHVYRRDDDATHSPMFMQLEGFMVDRGVSFAHLKGVLTHFLRRLFGDDVPVRFRPSYFPFVEPGGEVDVGCGICQRWKRPDAGACRVCKGSGWIEILGCGMIHPVVFEQVGYDPETNTGFAFGMGIDRVAMMRYGVGDVGLLYSNDARFLTQF